MTVPGGYPVEAVMLAGVGHALDRNLRVLTPEEISTLGYIAGLGRPPTPDEWTQALGIVDLLVDGAVHVKGARAMVGA